MATNKNMPPNKDSDNVRMSFFVDGKAVQFTPQHSIEFENGLTGEPIPVLSYKCQRVKKSWTLIARIHKAAEA